MVRTIGTPRKWKDSKDYMTERATGNEVLNIIVIYVYVVVRPATLPH